MAQTKNIIIIDLIYTSFKNVSEYIFYNPLRIFLFISYFILFFVNRMLFFIFLFLILDFFVSYIDKKFRIDLLLDFSVISIIIVSYTGSFGYLFLCLFLFLLVRSVSGSLSKRHLFKLPVLIVISYLTFIFNFISLNIIGGFIFFIRYILEYGLEYIATGVITKNRILKRIFHLIAAIIFFRLLGGIIIGVI